MMAWRAINMRELSQFTREQIQNASYTKVINLEDQCLVDLTRGHDLRWVDGNYTVSHVIVSETHKFNFRQVNFWCTDILTQLMYMELAQTLTSNSEEADVDLPVLEHSGTSWKWNLDTVTLVPYRVQLIKITESDIRFDFYAYTEDRMQHIFSVYPVYDPKGGIEETIISKQVAEKFNEYLTELRTHFDRVRGEFIEEGIITDEVDNSYDSPQASKFRSLATKTYTLDIMQGKLKNKLILFSQKELDVVHELEALINLKTKEGKVRQELTPVLFASMFPYLGEVKAFLAKVKTGVNNLGEIYGKVA